jgi:hypothetical protein
LEALVYIALVEHRKVLSFELLQLFGERAEVSHAEPAEYFRWMLLEGHAVPIALRTRDYSRKLVDVFIARNAFQLLLG